MFMFVLGFVFVFVILKGKLRNLCVYEICVCICVRIFVCVCDFEREIHRFETCGFDICVCVVIWGWVGRDRARGACRARWGRFGVGKKTRLLNEVGLGNGFRPAGRVWA